MPVFGGITSNLQYTAMKPGHRKVLVVTCQNLECYSFLPVYARKHIPHSKHQGRSLSDIIWRNQQHPCNFTRWLRPSDESHIMSIACTSLYSSGANNNSLHNRGIIHCSPDDHLFASPLPLWYERDPPLCTQTHQHTRCHSRHNPLSFLSHERFILISPLLIQCFPGHQMNYYTYSITLQPIEMSPFAKPKIWVHCYGVNKYTQDWIMFFED